MGKFFKSIGSAFQKLFSHAPSWSQTASTTLTLATPMLDTALSLVEGPNVASDAVNIIGEVKSDLAAASTLIAQSHSATDPGVVSQIKAALGSVSANLSTLLAAGHIKDEATLSKVTIAVNAFTGELSAILSVLPQAPATEPKT